MPKVKGEDMQILTLTVAQLQKVVRTIGDGSKPPACTDDPVVNHAIDCVVSDPDAEFDRELYEEEIKASKKQFGW